MRAGGSCTRLVSALSGATAALFDARTDWVSAKANVAGSAIRVGDTTVDTGPVRAVAVWRCLAVRIQTTLVSAVTSCRRLWAWQRIIAACGVSAAIRAVAALHEAAAEIVRRVARPLSSDAERAGLGRHWRRRDHRGRSSARADSSARGDSSARYGYAAALRHRGRGSAARRVSGLAVRFTSAARDQSRRSQNPEKPWFASCHRT